MDPSGEHNVPSIFLIGYRGSGKSSVGAALAEMLGFQFHDTDLLIESRTGKTISQYFAEAGEPAFRSLESEVLESLVERARAGEKMVIATGGGIVLSSRNIARLRSAGHVVWLVASVKTLEERISKDPASSGKRPPLQGRSSVEEVGKVLSERGLLYRTAAHSEVSVEGLSPVEAAVRVADTIAGKKGK